MASSPVKILSQLWASVYVEERYLKEEHMAYSVMVWLVDPGEQAHQEEELARSADRIQNPGAASGVNEPPAFTRLVYGVYEDSGEAENALGEISENLQHNRPLRLDMHGNRSFLVPANRVHYVVCDEVTRPRDRERSAS
jgi:hypothetical protein